MNERGATEAGLLGHSEPDGEASPRSAVLFLRDSHGAKAVVALMTAKRSKTRCEGRRLLEGTPHHLNNTSCPVNSTVKTNTALGDPPGQKDCSRINDQSMYIGSATWGVKM